MMGWGGYGEIRMVALRIYWHLVMDNFVCDIGEDVAVTCTSRSITRITFISG